MEDKGTKIYEIPERWNYDTKNFMENNKPIAVLKNGKYFGEVLKLNNKLYSTAVAVCAESGEDSAIFVRQIKMDIDETESSYESNIKCPICGYENQDSWEAEDSDDNYECPECHSILSYERSVTVEYNTEVVSVGIPITPELLEGKE